MNSPATRRGANARTLRLVEFNLHIARFAHRSWYEQMLPAEFLEGVSMDKDGFISARAEPQVSRWLLRHLGLQEAFDWDMSERRKRLWLLDSPALDRLARLLSLAMHRQWLLQIIDGSRLRLLRDVAGPESLRFVIEEVSSGSFHHPAPVVSFDGEPGTLVDRLRADGALTLFQLLEESWRAVRDRAVLYFERGTMHGAAPPLADRSDPAMELICGQLIPRRLPEWAWLF